jgi:hypothetical protein
MNAAIRLRASYRLIRRQGEIMTRKRQQRRRVSTSETRITFGPSANPALTDAILEIVDTQLRENTPPETRQTYDRLLGAGYDAQVARRLIGNIVVQEIFQVMKHGKAYNEQRFIVALNGLPDSAV